MNDIIITMEYYLEHKEEIDNLVDTYNYTLSVGGDNLIIISLDNSNTL